MAATLVVWAGDKALLIPVEVQGQIGVASVREHAGLVIVRTKSLNQSLSIHLSGRAGSGGILRDKLVISEVGESVYLHIEWCEALIVKPIVLLNLVVFRSEDIETMIELILTHDLVVPGDELQVLGKDFVVRLGLRVVNGTA